MLSIENEWSSYGYPGKMYFLWLLELLHKWNYLTTTSCVDNSFSFSSYHQRCLIVAKQNVVFTFFSIDGGSGMSKLQNLLWSISCWVRSMWHPHLLREISVPTCLEIKVFSMRSWGSLAYEATQEGTENTFFFLDIHS